MRRLSTVLVAVLALVLATATVCLVPVGTAEAVSNWSTQTGALGYQLADVDFVNAAEGWAVGGVEGGHGAIIHTSDSGASWARQGGDFAQELTGVDFYDAQNGIAVGYGGLILRTTNGGATWATMPSPVTRNLGRVSYASRTQCWIAGNWVYGDGFMLRSYNGGATWSKLTDWPFTEYPDGPLRVQDFRPGYIGFADSTHGAAVSPLAQGTVLRYSGAPQWSIYNLPPNPGAAATGDTDDPISVVSPWAITFHGMNAWLVGEWETDAGTPYVAVYQSRNGGQTWAFMYEAPYGAIDSYNIPRDIEFVSATEGWIVGDGGILHTNDGGRTWARESASNPGLVGVSGFGAKACAIGWHGEVFTRGTASAQPAPPSGFVEKLSVTGVPIHGVDFKGASNGIAVSDKGFVFVTTDGGTTWVKRSAPSGCFEVAMGDATHAWIGGLDRTRIFATSDGGRTWSPQSSNLTGTNSIARMSAADATHAFAVNYAANAVRTVNGSTWTLKAPPGAGADGGRFEGVHYLDARRAYLVGASFPAGWGFPKSHIYFTADGGTTWTSQANPGRGKLRATSFPDARHGWVGGYERDTLLRTVNGSTWTSLVAPCEEPLPSFNDANNGFVIQYFAQAGLYKTTNGGNTFVAYRFPGLQQDIKPAGAKTCIVGEVPTPNGPVGKIWVSDPSYVPPRTYTLTYKAGTGGTILGASRQTVNRGASGTQVEARAKTGYRFTKWSDNAVTARRIDRNVITNKTVTAYFNVVKRRVSLGAPVAPKAMKRSKYYVVYGSLKPRHTKGTKPVRDSYKYKKVGKTWVKKGYAKATAFNYRGYTRYKAKMRLTNKGKWSTARLRPS